MHLHLSTQSSHIHMEFPLCLLDTDLQQPLMIDHDLLSRVSLSTDSRSGRTALAPTAVMNTPASLCTLS